MSHRLTPRRVSIEHSHSSAGGSPPTDGSKPFESPQKALIQAMGITSADRKPHHINPLHFSSFQLMQQPNGGYGRILVKVRPHSLPEEAPQWGRAVVYCGANEPLENNDGEGQSSTQIIQPFWFLTNEGSITVFDIDQQRCLHYGVRHGDRVLSTWGPTAGTWSTVVGVRGGSLWVKDDGAHGATALFGLRSKVAIENALGWVPHGRQMLDPSTSVWVPVLTSDHQSVELLQVACDPSTMELCFGQGRFHGSIHVVTSLPFESATDDALLMVPVGVNVETGDLIAYFVDRSQSEMSATQFSGMGSSDPDAVPQQLLFGSKRRFALNGTSVTTSLAYASVLGGVQNPEGVTALLRPERLGARRMHLAAGSKTSVSDAALDAARSRRAQAAAPMLHTAAKILSQEGHSAFLTFGGLGGHRSISARKLSLTVQFSATHH